MSNLSDFLKKPYPGLSKLTVDQLKFAGVDTELRLTASDATVTGINSPILRMTGSYSAFGSGPAIAMEGPDDAAVNRTLAVVKSGFINNATAAVDTYAALTVLRIGAVRSVQLNGSTQSFSPTVVGQLTLGSTALGWLAGYFGDGTAQVKIDGANATAGVGTTSAHTFSLTTNSIARLAIGSAGQVAINAGVTPDVLSLLRVTGTHPNSATSLYGIRSDVTFPATTTVSAIGFFSSPATPNTAFTLPSLSHFAVLNATKGAASTITAQYGFFTGDLTSGGSNYGFYGALVAGANKYNLYMPGTAANFFLGETSVGVVGSGRNLNVETATAAQPVAHFRNTNAAVTADVVTIFGQNSSSAYNALKVTDNAGANKLLVRGDGQVLINTNTVINAAAGGGVLQIAGGVGQTVNQTFNGGACYGYNVSGTLTVPAGGQWWQQIYNITSIAFNAASPSQAIGTQTTMSGTTVANAQMYGMYYSCTDAGSGAAGGGYFTSAASPGHTGSLFGGKYIVNPVTTSGICYGLQVINFAGAGSGTLTYAIHVDGSGGSLMQYGLYFGNSINYTSATVYWAQRAAATADFLKMVDSGAATRFLVDVNGDMTLGGNGRRIKADLDNGTRSNRLHFIGTTVNGTSTVGVLPNGTATTSEFVAYNTNTPDAASYVALNALTGEMRVNSANAGGATKVLSLSIDGTYAVQVQTNRNVLLGPSGAVTGMTAGWPYMPAAAGAPSGTPTAYTGYCAFYYDTTNNKLYVYNGAWKSTAALT